MYAFPNTEYGSVSVGDYVKDTDGHNHVPNGTVLKLMGDALKAAPTPIYVHFDVGNYPAQTADIEQYIIRPDALHPDLARGGEQVQEAKCVNNDSPDDPRVCQFPDYPGVVGWKAGFQAIRDAWEASNGAQLDTAGQEACELAGGGTNCRRRFDLTRKDIFHYVFFGHYAGEPKSTDPTSQNFHVVTKRSGMGDRPGGDAIVTVGAWGNGFRGPDFVQASTMMHETGHHFWLTHSGNPFDLQTPNPVDPQVSPTGPGPLTPMESNCNPNYLSVMSYSLQIDGLISTAVPQPVLDFSRARLADSDGLFYTVPGRPAIEAINEYVLPRFLNNNPNAYYGSWYAPRATVHESLGTTVAKKHCNGTLITDGAQMIRITLPVSSPDISVGIDWNGDLPWTDVDRVGPALAGQTPRSTDG